jgi:hypothetical protein
MRSAALLLALALGATAALADAPAGGAAPTSPPPKPRPPESGVSGQSVMRPGAHGTVGGPSSARSSGIDGALPHRRK